ncbi:GSCOCG00008072001-RA-CDS, partial [Cotesia congregata]
FADNGRDSPPEPAPPEVPPRGPSLLATHTIRAVQNRNGCAGNTNFASDDAQSEAYS